MSVVDFSSRKSIISKKLGKIENNDCGNFMEEKKRRKSGACYGIG